MLRPERPDGCGRSGPDGSGGAGLGQRRAELAAEKGQAASPRGRLLPRLLPAGVFGPGAVVGSGPCRTPGLPLASRLSLAASARTFF